MELSQLKKQPSQPINLTISLTIVTHLFPAHQQYLAICLHLTNHPVHMEQNKYHKILAMYTILIQLHYHTISTSHTDD